MGIMNTIFIRYPMKMNEVIATMVARETGTGVFGVRIKDVE